MADDAAAAELKKRRTFRKFTYRGVDLDQLLDLNNEQLMELFPCRIRRKFNRGLKVHFEQMNFDEYFLKLASSGNEIRHLRLTLLEIITQ